VNDVQMIWAQRKRDQKSDINKPGALFERT